MKLKEILQKKHVLYIIQFFLLVCMIITRFWQLDELPLGMHYDEAGMAYDAWCLANYGVDRFLKPWPVYLINFGAGQSSLYAFLCAGLFKVFGYNIWLVRFPAVFFSFLTFIFGSKMAKRIFPEDNIMPIMLGAMVTFCPYFVLNSRFGFDCNLMLGASTVFLYFILTAIESGTIWRYIASGIAGGVMLYTYALSYISLPLFLFFCLIYVLIIRKFSIKKWICMAIPMGIVAFPIIMVQIVNLFELEEMMLGPFTITRLPFYRASEIGRFRWSYLVNALKHIFVGDGYAYDSIPGIWNLYAITVVLFAIGLLSAMIRLIQTIKKRQFLGLTIPFMWFFAVLLFQCHIVTETYTLNGIFLAVAILTVEGMAVLVKRAGKLYPILIVCVCGIYALCFIRFGVFYYSGRYTENTYPIIYFGVVFEDAVEFIENDEILKERLTYVSEYGIFYAISSKVSPYEFGLSGDQSIQWNNYWFGSLPEISGECNYLVRDGLDEYCDELRQAGFTEKRYDHYSLFYKE